MPRTGWRWRRPESRRLPSSSSCWASPPPPCSASSRPDRLSGSCTTRQPFLDSAVKKCQNVFLDPVEGYKRSYLTARLNEQAALFLDSAVKKCQNVFLDPAGDKWSFLTEANEKAAFSGLCRAAVKKFQNVFLDHAEEKWSYLILKKVFSTNVNNFF